MVTADYLSALAEAKGRQELFTHQSPQRLLKLREHSLIESAISSNRIEGVEVDRSRVNALILGKPVLRDRPEEEVVGYRKALELIHSRAAKFPISTANILRLHKLIRGDIWDAGKLKEKVEPITEEYPNGRRRVRFMPLDARKTPKALREACELSARILKNKSLPAPLVLGAFNLDFLCIHPFRDGNGRVSRLLLLLQTYQLGFEVGRYISLERLIEQNKDRYYETLEASSHRWHEGKNDPWPYLNFLLYIIKSAYKEFESRVALAPPINGDKTARIHAAISELPMEFSTAQLERACPGISHDMIRTVLRSLRDSKKLASKGRGPGAVWRKIGKGVTPKKKG